MTRRPSVVLDGTGHGLDHASVPSFFWLSAGVVVACLAMGLPLASPPLTLAAAGLILAGGLPHGAFDIALATRALRLGKAAAVTVIGLYLLVALFMVLAWSFAPLAALALFLVMSAFHFGEDWAMLDDGLLRAMAGTSIVCAACVGQSEAVSQLFSLLAGGPQGAALARLGIIIAPMVFLITAVGLAIAWQQGCRQWALAQATALACLLLAPPVISFATYFVLLHAPRHMRVIVRDLRDWTPRQRRLCGGGLSLLCIGVLLLFDRSFLAGDALLASTQTFRLLSIVAAPHLLLSIYLERFIRRKVEGLHAV